ncbi:MAG TPA: hypothetical protein DHV28_12945 [Ignavibacteriales bacterium]|nr:hypothetical protein [Ignavibacteriales bacterium]
MSTVKIVIVLSFLCIISFLFLSCDLITEPERLVDKNNIPPEAGDLQLNDLVEGQHVDGTLRFSIDTAGLIFIPTGIGVFIDGQEYTRYPNNSYIIEIDTRRYSEGPHKIAIGYYQEDPNHGLLNLFYIPSVYLETGLYFDRTPPAQISITTNEEENGFTRINWDESPNQNFLEYRILKSYDNVNWETLETIKSRQVTSLIDSVDVVLNGVEVKYKLIHSTGYTSIESNIITQLIGQELEYYVQQSISKRGLISNRMLNEIYFMIDKKIIGFSSLDNLFKKEIFLSDIPSGPPFASFAVSKDGQRIFVYNNYGRKLWILGANLFYVIGSVTLNVPEELRTESDEIIHIDQNKILLFGKYEKLRLVDYSQNIVLDSLVIANTNIQCVTVSNDRTKLIVGLIDKNVFPNVYKIQIRNLGLSGFPVINEIVTDAPCYKIMTSSDDQRLIELPSQSTKLNIRNINSLNITGFLNSEQNQRITDFALSEDKCYLYQQFSIIYNGNTKSVFKTTRFDINSLNPEMSQYLSNVWSYNIDISGNNIYVPTSSILNEKNIIGISIKK